MRQSDGKRKKAGDTARPARRTKNPKARWIKLAVIAVVVLLLIALFINLGDFLMVNETPVKSDVIIVLAGDDGPRTAYGIALYQEGYADKLLFSGCVASTAEMMNQADELGVPSGDIIVEDQSESTYDNAVNSRALLLEYGYKSAIVVTSDYHMKRSSLVFKKAFKDTGISLV
jgi:uncharacterized SAM-binding protein YcdF (DUF218 family)